VVRTAPPTAGATTSGDGTLPISIVVRVSMTGTFRRGFDAYVHDQCRQVSLCLLTYRCLWDRFLRTLATRNTAGRATRHFATRRRCCT
jgi:hypothetical protein